jgi:hypothetical protein
MSDLEDYKREENRFLDWYQGMQERAKTDDNAGRFLDTLAARGVDPFEFLESLRDIARSKGLRGKAVDEWMASTFREWANRLSADGRLRAE